MLTPIEFGLPHKFTEWRADQLTAVDQIVNSEQRFVTVCAPTGFGKSLAYEAAAMMMGLRTVVCTSTKGLQDQLVKDFGEINADIRGQSNYACSEAHNFGIISAEPVTVEMGPCHSGAKCVLKEGGCEYYDKYRAAQRADIVVTNYALWMTDRIRGEDRRLNSLKPVEMLVLDEAHDAPDALAGHLATEMKYSEISRIGHGVEWPGAGEDQEAWKGWAKETWMVVDGLIKGARQQIEHGQGGANLIRKVAEWGRLKRKVERLATMQGEWVVEAHGRDNWRVRKWGPIVQFDPLWPAAYAESVLFRGVKKVVLVSATVRPKTAQLLGIGSAENNFREYASSFPIHSRPVISVPTVQMSYRMGEWATIQWINKMDRLMDQRRDKKGVIHTVSYDRAKLISLNSKHASRMLLHDTATRQATVLTFKSKRANTTVSGGAAVLVSPSVDTGYDFPYTECEWQIISKIPFADNRGKVLKARIKSDPEYSNYMTALTIVQMVGRGMRAADDRCETIIVDDNFVWYFNKNKQHFPKWFIQSVKFLGNGQMPIPLEKL